MEHIEKKVEFKSDRGITLRGRFILPEPENERPSPIVVMLTGDGNKGTKSLTWTNLPPMLLTKNIGSFLFDFEGLGYSDGYRQHLTLSVGLSNLISAMQAVAMEPLVDQTRIGILGSSFGGNVAILYAAQSNNIRCLGLKSPVSFYPDSFYCEYGEERMKAWEQNGFVGDIGFEYEFYLDALRFNTYESAMKITCPCLITHGNADIIVPLTQSKHLFVALRNTGAKEFIVLEGVGHGYSEPGAWEKMASIFQSWFAEMLI